MLSRAKLITTLLLASLMAHVAPFASAQGRAVPNGRYLGSLLVCDDGFRAIQGRCEQLPSVTNGRYLGALLICDDGFRDMGGRCQPLPRVTNGRYLGALLICDDGYKDVRGQCEQMAAVTNGRYLGALLICDDGYKDVGGRCEKLAVVTNGRYLGSLLICDDGYQDRGGQCYPLPGVSNGRYLGSLLICDDGYQDNGGQCRQLRPIENSQFVGATVVCDAGYRFFNEQCVRAAGTTDLASRVDPIAVARSARVTVDSLAAYDSQYWGSNAGETRSGTSFDAQSGNHYSWDREFDGSTRVRGMNMNSGSTWTTTIEPNGSMRGFDKGFNPWSYDSGTGTYINYGTGKMCFGKGAARTCF